MAEANRKLSDKFVAELKSDYSKLLNEIRSDSELRLEIRQNQVLIYYKKNKILDISSKSLNVSPKYKGPLPENAKDNPKNYFDEMKKCIDNFWLNENINKQEFETQQKIASANSNFDSEYIILEMEYGPSRDILDEKKRPKKASFDLLGIKKTGEIILFEVKKGTKALENDSGIDEHIKDFENFFRKEYKETFLNILEEDIKGIIESKGKLGISNLPDINSIKYEDVKFMFIFEPSDDKNQEAELKEYEDLVAGRYPTIFVKPNDYILRCPT